MTLAQMQQELERCLLATMAKLCKDSATSDVDACRKIQTVGLFEMTTPFERINEALGPGRVAEPRVIEDGPASFGASVEHRYSLSPWPSFDFVILESEDGIAWGYRFARRIGLSPPSVRTLADLGQWSHLESEVRAALGEPISHEGWPPWEGLVYRLGGSDVILCFVFGLLQNVTKVAK